MTSLPARTTKKHERFSSAIEKPTDLQINTKFTKTKTFETFLLIVIK